MAKKIELNVPEREDRELEELSDALQDMVDLLDEQPLKEEDRELLNTIYERQEIFEQVNREYHEEAKNCRKILHMDDPDQDDAVIVSQNGKPTL